jgi:UDP-N-acetylmuramate--alanine ligase
MRLKDGVAVAGTHGKTTTTSLVAHILGEAGLDPTAIIGGRVLAPERDATGARLGAGEILVAEADESDGSFLRLAPVMAIVTNIDADHLDHYGSFEALEQAFVDFVNRLPFWGVAVLCLDHPGIQSILPRLTRRLFTYGFSHQADLVAEDVEASERGMRFVVRLQDKPLGPVEISLPGRHNVANALAALAIALELEIPWQTAARAIESFSGIERRFERKGSAAGVQVVDDYGHHPAEVRATLAAAREAHRGRIVTVFQPHRYTRTRDCFDDFATAFNDTDLLVLTEIYAAGEEAIPGIGGEPLAEAIRAHGHRNVCFVAELDEVANTLPSQLEKGDLVLTLGAGDVSTLGPRLLEALRSQGGAP